MGRDPPLGGDTPTTTQSYGLPGGYSDETSTVTGPTMAIGGTESTTVTIPFPDLDIGEQMYCDGCQYQLDATANADGFDPDFQFHAVDIRLADGTWVRVTDHLNDLDSGHTNVAISPNEDPVFRSLNWDRQTVEATRVDVGLHPNSEAGVESEPVITVAPHVLGFPEHSHPI